MAVYGLARVSVVVCRDLGVGVSGRRSRGRCAGPWWPVRQGNSPESVIVGFLVGCWSSNCVGMLVFDFSSEVLVFGRACPRRRSCWILGCPSRGFALELLGKKIPKNVHLEKKEV